MIVFSFISYFILFSFSLLNRVGWNTINIACTLASVYYTCICFCSIIHKCIHVSLCQINWMNMNKLIQLHNAIDILYDNCTIITILEYVRLNWFVGMFTCRWQTEMVVHEVHYSQGAPAIICKYWFIVFSIACMRVYVCALFSYCL